MSPPSPQRFLFSDYISSGYSYELNPFLTANSRGWGKHLSLKAAILASVLLVVAFCLSYFFSCYSLSSLFLLFVYFIAGTPSLIDAVKDLLDLQLNIDVLMTLAAFSSVLLGSGHEGALLLVLFSLSGAIERNVSDQANKELRKLEEVSPSLACVILSNNTILQKSVRDIKVGTHILVRAGEVIPLDGIIVNGSSSVNLVHLTGEATPVSKEKNESVPAGGKNLDGTLTIKVTHTSADSTLTQIIRLISQAQESRPKLERWLNSLSQRYATTIIFLSFFLACVLPYISSLPFLGTEGSIYRGLSFLIAASPCALILAIPITYLSAVSACAKRGILLKGGTVLDALSNCSAIAFDKTGTLSTANLKLSQIINISNSSISQETMLAISATLERNAVHPIAKALTLYAKEKSLKLPDIQNFKNLPGKGVSAEVYINQQWQAVKIGRPDLIRSTLDADNLHLFNTEIKKAKQEAKIITCVKIGQCIWILFFQDTLRHNIDNVLHKLKSAFRFKIIMLSGDHHQSVQKVCQKLDIDDYHAELSPDEKLQHISELSKTHHLAMVGDGVNDAPALARATVGIAMGQVGSFTAIDVSDIILLQDDIHELPWLIHKSKQTQAIVKQNLILSASMIVLTSFCALLGTIPLWLAVIMHEGATIVVGLNGLRLLSQKDI